MTVSATPKKPKPAPQKIAKGPSRRAKALVGDIRGRKNSRKIPPNLARIKARLRQSGTII